MCEQFYACKINRLLKPTLSTVCDNYYILMHKKLFTLNTEDTRADLQDLHSLLISFTVKATTSY